MEESDSVKRLFDEALLLSNEDRDDLTSLLVSYRHRVIEESTVYLREEQSDGRIVTHHRVRPEDRRAILGKKRFDLFGGIIKLEYFPPPAVNDIRKCLEQYAGRSHQKDPARKKRVSEIIEEMSQELFWKLPQKYEEMTREAENDLRHDIQNSLLKKIGMNLETVFDKGAVRVVRKTKRGVTQRLIENPNHRPKGTGSFDQDAFFDDLESTILRLAKNSRNGHLTYEQVAPNLKHHSNESGEGLRKQFERCSFDERYGKKMKWREYVKYVLKEIENKNGQEVRP